MKFVDDYVIGPNTGAVISKTDHLGNRYCQVYELRRSFFVKGTTNHLMNESIQHYGFNLKGAMEAARKALGNVYRPPIKVSGSLGMYWFPIHSLGRYDNIWFALEHIKDYDAMEKDATTVQLQDGQTISIDIGERVFRRRLSVAREFRDIMEDRLKETSHYWAPHQLNAAISESYKRYRLKGPNR